MENQKNRRDFLRTAAAALVAASVPTVLLAQKDDARPPSGNNLKQMIIFGGVSEPLPSLPGIFGQASWQFQMVSDTSGSGGGIATISDLFFTEVNSHIKIHSGRLDINDIYVFQGTVERSNSSVLIGKSVVIKVKVLPSDNCDVWLAIEDTPVQVGMLLPAIQKVGDKNGL